MKNILVIGSINVDYVSYVDQMPGKGETIIANDFKIGPGGKGNNLANTLHSLDCDVELVGAIGTDENGRYLKSQMSSVGMKTSGLVEIQNVPTGMAFITVDSKADNTIIVSSGANSLLLSDHISDEKLKQFGIVCGSLENPHNTLIEVFRRANELGVLTVLNFSPSSKIDVKLFQYTDIFVSNKREFDKIIDYYGVSTAAEFQQKFKCKAVIITLGKSGVTFSTDFKQETLSGFIMENVIDTAGAGDYFLATFLASYVRGFPVSECVDIGQKGGALSVTQKGTQHKFTFTDIMDCTLERRKIYLN
jgi:ribokinase